MPQKPDFATKLLAWYQRHRRDLPWRHTTDPYLIWLSEVILQQTRVKQGLPYYLKFAGHFPTIQDLAAADERTVLRLWQGLGYYTRARNMHQTAQFIVGQLDGTFPNTYAGLLQLRGVGPYIAAAIASFAFRERVAVVDGNVFRVLARVFGIETDIASHAGKIEFTRLANELISAEHPDTYNQAIMEFGALLCTPASPQCMFCPFQANCVAFASGNPEQFPVKSKKAAVKNRFFHYLVISDGDTVALRERTGNDIWRGLFDFYLIEETSFQPIRELLRANVPAALSTIADMGDESPVHTHLLSHQRVQAKFWPLHVPTEARSLVEKTLGVTFYTLPEIHDLPKPVLINNYLNEHFFSLSLE